MEWILKSEFDARFKAYGLKVHQDGVKHVKFFRGMKCKNLCEIKGSN